jgi:hypothetical protein
MLMFGAATLHEVSIGLGLWELLMCCHVPIRHDLPGGLDSTVRRSAVWVISTIALTYKLFRVNATELCCQYDERFQDVRLILYY